MIKKCYICKEFKKIECFNKNRSKKDGHKDECRKCQKEQSKRWYRKNVNNKPKKMVYGRTKKDRLLRRRYLRDKLKKEVFSYYSYGAIKCSICGFDDMRALCLDHIKDNGAEERRPLGGSGGTRFYRYVKKMGFPDGYQVLCFNCNIIKEYNKRLKRHQFL